MKSSNYLLECCVDSAYSARMAKKGGADRLELCSNLVIGGTTPTLALYEQIRNQTDIRIHVLIRPRFGDFLYSEDETALICKEIDAFRAAGADGVVIGSLSPNGSLCTANMPGICPSRCIVHLICAAIPLRPLRKRFPWIFKPF